MLGTKGEMSAINGMGDQGYGLGIRDLRVKC